MVLSKRSSLGLALVAGAMLVVGCDNPAPTGGAPSGAPAGTGAPTAKATAAPTATAAAAGGKVPGIETGEIVAGSCNTVEKDSECGEVVVKSDADKAKTTEALKALCKGKLGDAACSADKMVGTCRVGKDIINHYYSEGPKAYTAESAQKACDKGMGRWVKP